MQDKNFISKMNIYHHNILSGVAKTLKIKEDDILELKWSNKESLIVTLSDKEVLVKPNNSNLRKQTQEYELKLIIEFKEFIIKHKKEIQQLINRYFKDNFTIINCELKLNKFDEIIGIKYVYNKNRKIEIPFYKIRKVNNIYENGHRYNLENISKIIIDIISENIDAIEHQDAMSKVSIYRQHIIEMLNSVLPSDILIENNNEIYYLNKGRKLNTKLSLKDFINPNQDFEENIVTKEIQVTIDESVYMNNIANMIIGRIKNIKLYLDSEPGKAIRKSFSECFNPYINKAIPCLIGMEKFKIDYSNYYTYYQDTKDYFETPISITTIDDKNISTSFKKELFEFEQLLHFEEFEKCFDYAKNRIDSCGYMIDYIKGKGVLLGDTTISIKKSFWTESYQETLVITSCFIGFDAWKKEFEKQLKDCFDRVEKKHQLYSKDFESKNSNLVGLDVIRDIFNIFILNPNDKAITFNVIRNQLTNARCGHKLKVNIYNRGHYKHLNDKKIQEILSELVNKKYLKTKIQIGRNGQFEYYSLNKSIIELMSPMICDIEEIKEKIKKNKSLKDDECKCLLKDKQQKKFLTEDDYKELLYCINNIAFINNNREHFYDLINNCNIDIIPNYIKNLIQNENNVYKLKLLKEIHIV